MIDQTSTKSQETLEHKMNKQMEIFPLLEDLKNIKNNDIGDFFYRMTLTYDEIIDILDLKYFPTKRTGYSPNPDNYKLVDSNNTLKYNLRNNL